MPWARTCGSNWWKLRTDSCRLTGALHTGLETWFVGVRIAPATILRLNRRLLPPQRVVGYRPTSRFFPSGYRVAVPLAGVLYLLLASFSLHQLTANPELLLSPLADAIQKHGLKVQFLVRVRNNMESHRKDAWELEKLGVRVFGDSLNHAKAVIADRSRGAIFSANYDAEHGLNNGVEVGVRLCKSAALESVVQFIEHSIDHAETELQVTPTHRQLNDRLAAGWRFAWNDDYTQSLTCSEADWDRFAECRSGQVTLFSSEANTLELMRGNWKWRLRRDPRKANSWTSDSLSESGRPSSEMFREWLSRRVSGNHNQAVRGICPFVLRRTRESHAVA